MNVKMNVWYKVKKSDTEMFLRDLEKIGYIETPDFHDMMIYSDRSKRMFSAVKTSVGIYLVALPINSHAVEYHPWSDIEFL